MPSLTNASAQVEDALQLKLASLPVSVSYIAIVVPVNSRLDDCSRLNLPPPDIGVY